MKTISKVPVTHEDIAIGVGKVMQQRGQESVEVSRVELSWIFRTTDEIRNLDVVKYSRVQLHQTGAADEYWYDASSIGTDNGSTVLKPNAISAGATGRWLLVIGSGSSGASIPLAGTLVGNSVTGPIHFDNSMGDDTYIMQTDIVGPDTFGFLTNRNGTSFVLATKNDAGVVQGFSFTEEGQITLPSNDGTNQEGWRIGAGTVLGDPDVLIFAPIDALGNVRTHPIAFVVSPTYTFVMSASGYLEAPRSTIVGDPDNAFTTKAYVESILPPGGGEANTASSPGASGEDLVMAKVGIDLQFKKLIAGTDITLTAGADGITIDGIGGAGGGLPAGSIDQGLRNDAGTNTYVATSGLLVDAAGNVAVGPGSLTPVVPLQVEGQATLRSGGQLNLNSPVNSATSIIKTTASNRLDLQSPAGGGIDINGATSTGAAVKISANGQDVFVANGATVSWAQILHGGTVHMRSTTLGMEVHGNLQVKDLDTGTLYFSVDSAGDGHFGGDCDITGDLVASTVSSYLGGINSAIGFTQDGAQGSQAHNLTRKDYVDSGLAGKSSTSHNHAGVYVNQDGSGGVTGDLGVNGTLTALIVESTLGNLVSASQVTIGASTPTATNMATRKDYVDSGLAGKSSTSHNHSTVYVALAGNQTVTGEKTFSNATVVNSTFSCNGGGSTGNWLPGLTSNTHDLGANGFRWRTLYTNNAVSVSDVRKKQQIRQADSAEVLVAKELAGMFKMYKLNEEVESGNAKHRCGVMAQELIEVFASHGLSADDYAMLHRVDDDLNINYTELMAFILMGMIN